MFIIQDSRDCKTFLLQTGFCSVYIPFKTGCTVLNDHTSYLLQQFVLCYSLSSPCTFTVAPCLLQV